MIQFNGICLRKLKGISMLEDPCERNEQTVNNVSTRTQVMQIELSKQSQRVQASQAKHGKLEVSQSLV